MKQDRVFGEPVLDMPETNRRGFLKVAGLVGIGTGLVAGGFGTSIASAADSGGVTDIDILNYALTLEYLESTFYNKAVDKVDFANDREQAIVNAVSNHENAHVKKLSGALGDKAISKDSVGIHFPDGTFKHDKFFKTAATFEEVGVTAYLGQAANLKNKDYLAVAAAIEGVEARHSAIFFSLTGQDPFPKTIDQGATMKKVKGEIAPFVGG